MASSTNDKHTPTASEVIFRTIRRAGKTMVVPIKAARERLYAWAKKPGEYAQKFQSAREHAVTSALDRIAGADPSVLAGRIADYFGIALESVAKHALDQMVEKAEHAAASQVEDYQRRLQIALTRKLMQGQIALTKRVPEVKSEGLSPIQRPLSLSGKKRLRTGFTLAGFKKEMQDVARRLQNMGIDVKSPQGMSMLQSLTMSQFLGKALEENERLRTRAVQLSAAQSGMLRAERIQASRYPWKAPFEGAY